MSTNLTPSKKKQIRELSQLSKWKIFELQKMIWIAKKIINEGNLKKIMKETIVNQNQKDRYVNKTIPAISLQTIAKQKSTAIRINFQSNNYLKVKRLGNKMKKQLTNGK